MAIPRIITKVVPLPQTAQNALPEYVHLVPIGTWFDIQNNREVALSPAMVRGLYDRARSYEADMWIDWRHASLSNDPAKKREAGKAAAWLERSKLELRADGIWGYVKGWTTAGAADVLAGEYRYLSPLILWEYPHKKTGEIGPELWNAGLTNSPLLDGIKPLIAEAFAGISGETLPTERRKSMKWLIEWLKKRGATVADDAGEDAVQSAFEAEFTKLDGEKDAVPADLAEKLGHEGEQPMTTAEAKTAIDTLAAQVPADVAKAFGKSEITAGEASASILKLRTDQSKNDQIDVQAIAGQVEARLTDKQALQEKVKGGAIPPAMASTYEALLASDDPDTVAGARKLVAEAKPTGPLAPGLGDTPPHESHTTAAEAAAEKQVCDQLGLSAKDLKEESNE